MRKIDFFLYNALYFRVADKDARKSLSDGLALKLAECEPSEKKAVLRECKENIKASFKLDGFKIYLTVLNVLAILAAVLLPISPFVNLFTNAIENFLWLVVLYSNFSLAPLFILSFVVGLILRKVKFKYSLYNVALCILSILLFFVGMYIILYVFGKNDGDVLLNIFDFIQIFLRRVL